MSLSALSSGGEGRSLAPLSRSRLVVYFLILVAWIAYAPKIVPYRGSDRGIFVSVAERLLAGDILNKDVLDNKDPLFYYFVALERIVGAYGEILGELVLLVIASYSVYRLASIVLEKNISLVIGWIMAPFILTGQHYIPGYTELPGVALVLLSIYNAAAGRWLIAGALAAILLVAKLIFFPLALTSLACFVAYNFQKPNILYALAGFFLALVGIGLILETRGEFVPLLDMVSDNLLYANNSLLIPADTWLGRSYRHLNEVLNWACWGSYGLMFVVSIAGVSRRINNNRVLRSFSWLTIGLATTSLMILAFTGLWWHHAQVAFIPAVIALIVFVGLLKQRLPISGGVTIVVLAMTFFLAGAPTGSGYLWNVEHVSSNIAVLEALPLEARYVIENSSPTSYARLGQNNDGAHAIGLRDWKLACRKFDQYEFDDVRTLQEVEQCIPRAEILIVSDSFVKYPDRYVEWNKFVDRMNEIVASRFECKVMSEIKICKNRLLGGG
jgi:hypothetical protein